MSPHASAEVIQAAYRALARGYHPDLNGGGDEAGRMRAINAAYAMLSDPARRIAYDARSRALRTRELRQLQTRQRAVAASGVARADPLIPSAVPLRRATPRAAPSRAVLMATMMMVATVVMVTVVGFWALAAAMDDPPLSPTFEQLRDVGQLRDGAAQPFLNPR